MSTRPGDAAKLERRSQEAPGEASYGIITHTHTHTQPPSLLRVRLIITHTHTHTQPPSLRTSERASERCVCACVCVHKFTLLTLLNLSCVKVHNFLGRLEILISLQEEFSYVSLQEEFSYVSLLELYKCLGFTPDLSRGTVYLSRTGFILF